MKKKQNNKLEVTDLVPWVKEVDSWTQEQKEKKAAQILNRLDLLRFIWDARRLLSENKLDAFHYGRVVNGLKAEAIALNKCHCASTKQNHDFECGVCEECVGTGRTFLLMTTRSRGVKCVACNGDGLRHKEFEQSDFRFMMSDDLASHVQELHSMQIEQALEYFDAASRSLDSEEERQRALSLLKDENEMLLTFEHHVCWEKAFAELSFKLTKKDEEVQDMVKCLDQYFNIGSEEKLRIMREFWLELREEGM